LTGARLTASLRRSMKKIAADLRKEDKRKWTQAKVAQTLGVARETVRDWFGTNGVNANASDRPDARVKVPPKARPRLARLVPPPR